MHFKLVCSCGRIIAQCRCPDLNKRETVVDKGCDVCRNIFIDDGEHSEGDVVIQEEKVR